MLPSLERAVFVTYTYTYISFPQTRGNVGNIPGSPNPFRRLSHAVGLARKLMPRLAGGGVVIDFLID